MVVFCCCVTTVVWHQDMSDPPCTISICSWINQWCDRLCKGNRQFVTCLLPWLPAFHPMPVSVGFVVYKVVLGQVFLLICIFPLFIIIQSMLSFTIDQICGILVTDSSKVEYLKHTHQWDKGSVVAVRLGYKELVDLWLQFSWDIKSLLICGCSPVGI